MHLYITNSFSLSCAEQMFDEQNIMGWQFTFAKANEQTRGARPQRVQSPPPMQLSVHSRKKKTFPRRVVPNSPMLMFAFFCYGNFPLCVNVIWSQLHYSVVFESTFHNDANHLSIYTCKLFKELCVYYRNDCCRSSSVCDPVEERTLSKNPGSIRRIWKSSEIRWG